jgi:hypothetical protein
MIRGLWCKCDWKQELSRDAVECKDGCSALLTAIARRKFLLARKLLNLIPQLATSVTVEYEHHHQPQQQQALPPLSNALHAAARACQSGWASYDCMCVLTHPKTEPYTPFKS